MDATRLITLILSSFFPFPGHWLTFYISARIRYLLNEHINIKRSASLPACVRVCITCILIM